MINKVTLLQLLLILLVWPTQLSYAEEDDASFRIVVDKLRCHVGETIDIEFLIINKAEVRLYVPRTLSLCSSPTGSFLLQVVDRNGHDVTPGGCSGDVTPSWMNKFVQDINNPERWISLKPGEIWGINVKAFTLPKKKGTYQLKAELFSPALNAQQRQELANQNVRVLQKSYRAPIVTITIK